MNYNICLALKKAGFPQDGDERNIESGFDNDGNYGSAYEPTLSELIEACVNINPAFTVSTTFGPLGWGNEKFEATALGVDTVTGSTPEEAVAKLYLSLYA